MRPHIYTSEGIILGRKNYGEADRIISLYSKDSGRVSLLAKGIRRPISRKRGSLEIFSYIKFQSINSKSIGLITEAEIIDDFKEIRKSLPKITLAYYFMEVTGKITHEGEKNHQLFELIIKSLKDLKAGTKLKTLRLKFINELLVMMGYWPEGKEMQEHDKALEEVIERQISTTRVAKKILN